MTHMDAFARGLGYALMVAGGFALAGCCVWLGSQWCWRNIRSAYSLAWLQRAIRAHRKVEPLPGPSGGPLQW